MNDELWKLIGEREENRTAFLAALIMDRCKRDLGDVGPGKARIVSRFQPFQAARIADKLASLAGLIKSLSEEACNRELTEGQERTLERRCKAFSDIAGHIGMEARTGGDPRGACAYLIDPHKPEDGDGWGNGWAVYR